jgi:hypothetical protein
MDTKENGPGAASLCIGSDRYRHVTLVRKLNGVPNEIGQYLPYAHGIPSVPPAHPGSNNSLNLQVMLLGAEG